MVGPKKLFTVVPVAGAVVALFDGAVVLLFGETTVPLVDVVLFVAFVVPVVMGATGFATAGVVLLVTVLFEKVLVLLVGT